MKIDAIIFDKDGTLIDFDAFWVGVSIGALEDILSRLGRDDIPIDEILGAYGVENGVTDMNGVLCKGTYAEMGDILADILTRHGCRIGAGEAEHLVTEAYKKCVDCGKILPTCQGLYEALSELKKRKISLAVVTTDNPEITRKCLSTLGIYELFDKIYTDDGLTPTKPAPDAALDFMKRVGTVADRTLMVGDTMTDVAFARNAGIRVIGVCKTEAGRAQLLQYADGVISEISELPRVIEGGE